MRGVRGSCNLASIIRRIWFSPWRCQKIPAWRQKLCKHCDAMAPFLGAVFAKKMHRFGPDFEPVSCTHFWSLPLLGMLTRSPNWDHFLVQFLGPQTKEIGVPKLRRLLPHFASSSGTISSVCKLACLALCLLAHLALCRGCRYRRLVTTPGPYVQEPVQGVPQQLHTNAETFTMMPIREKSASGPIFGTARLIPTVCHSLLWPFSGSGIGPTIGT